MNGICFKEDSIRGMKKWANVCLPGLDKSYDSKSTESRVDVLSAWGRVQKNGRFGKPLQISGRIFKRGIYCHAPAVIAVKLARPAKSFKCVIGIDDALQWDARDDYQSGPLWPKAELVVEDKTGREIFKSEAICNGTCIDIEVLLDGASEFVIKVSGVVPDGSQGYLNTDGDSAWDARAVRTESHDWCDIDLAEARVEYPDGASGYLDEFPMAMKMMKEEEDGALPFDFIYGGRSFRENMGDWRISTVKTAKTGGREEYAITFADNSTGLEVKCVCVTYSGFPVTEWTLFFKNTGSGDTKIIEGIKALDIGLERGEGTEFVLHYNYGGICRIDDYRPVEETMPVGCSKKIRCVTGYPSDPYMPYFNIEDGAGEGLIAAIGWPGQWAAEFTRDGGKGIRVSAGQETTRFYLKPGEEVRSPLIALMRWRGDRIGSQNLWRRWMVEYGMPRVDGRLPDPIMAGGNDGVFVHCGKTEENQFEFINRYTEEKIELNMWWMDLGWHSFAFDNSVSHYTTTWEPDPVRFPRGLKPVSDLAASRGMKTIAWFNPEHMNFGGHREWLIWGTADEPLMLNFRVRTLDLGNPDALAWITDHIDGIIKKEGIGCFRIDTGWGMLPEWIEKDEPDRAGISEIRYVTGYLKLFDELLQRNPGLLIDNCCRGGRRLDLESCRRSVPLWRSDMSGHDVSNQCQTYGLSFWLPYSGTSVNADPYSFRSAMCASIAMGFDMRDRNLDYEEIRRLTSQWKEICGDYYGDFYPLTSYSCRDYGWNAIQFNTPEKGTGFVQIFRRAKESPAAVDTDTMFFKLRGLDEDAEYMIKDMDAPGETAYTGKELAEAGLKVCAGLRTAKLFSYRRI